MHELVLNKTLAGKRLPDGSIGIAAANEGDEYQLTDLDPALVSRFNLYEFAPTVEDWLLWASDNGIDPRLIIFMQQNRQYLDGGDTTSEELQTAYAGLVKTPDRRSWVRVSHFIAPLKQIDELHVKIIAGMVGTAAALALRRSLTRTLPVTVEQILLQFERHKAKLATLPLEDLVMLNEQLVLWLNSGQYKPGQEETVRRYLLAYMHALQQAQQREAVAHLASLLEHPRFERAMTFVAASLDIIELLTAYIEGIKVD